MKYLKVILKGYKRLALNNIDYIELTPQSKIQLVLGTNGCGKSSLIKEISPLPALPAEYTKEGFKHVEISHQNNLYVLRSSFGSVNKFNFIKNGEELNPGGTATVFKELVKKEFNYTAEVHELLTGVNGFHLMTISERRNWFTKISPVDFNFAIQYYSKLKEQQRDIQGAVKLGQARLIQESEKLLTPESESVHREEIKTLTALLNYFLNLKSNTFVSQSDVLNQIREQDKQIEKYSQQIIDLRSRFLNVEKFSSLEDIDFFIINTQARIQSNNLEIEKLCKLIESKQNTVKLLNDNNIKSIKDIDKHIDQHSVNVSNLTKQLVYPQLSFTDNKVARSALESIHENLCDIFIHIEENKDKRYSTQIYNETVNKHKQLVNDLNSFTAKEQEFLNKKKELEHLKTHSEIECPKCQHRWFQGYSDQAYAQVLKMLETITQDVKYINESLKKADSYIQNCKLYFDYYRSYVNITKSWSVLNPLWDYLLNNNIVFDNPKQIVQILEALRQDILIRIKINDEEEMLKNNIKIKESLSKDQELNLQTTQQEIEDLDKQLFTLYELNESNKRFLRRYQMYKSSSIEIDKLLKLIEDIADKRNTKAEQISKISEQEALNEAIRLTRLELSQREQTISKIDIQKALVTNIQNQISEMNEKVELYAIAVKELSPVEGLIAKGLTGFINHFVKQMNSFIKTIWLYPLELVPIVPSEEGIDLDFKFEVKINDSILISDVSKTSSAMKEVIDLAFKVTSMKYLGLLEAPLYLDEFASRMDSEHRKSAFYAITNLLTNSNFSQIFMISHYENTYGSMRNTDITVLSSANVNLPKDLVYNQNTNFQQA